MKIFCIYLFFAVLIKDGSCVWYHCEGTGDQCECDKTATVCETSFVIEGRLTMVDPVSKTVVVPSGGQLYLNGSNEVVPIKNVISADGYNDISRMVVVANGTMPAPPLIVYEGQQLIINVINKLHSESVTIHWHGLPQIGWEYMDGVPYLSQCPILSGQSFLYNFKATPSGTYWFHSHMGNQRGKGLFGALIIRELNPKINYDEHIMTLIEWNHLWDADVALIRKDSLEHAEEADFQSGLINGRGRFNQNGEVLNAPLEIYNVTQGKQYRFRMVGAGMMHKFEVSVDEHKLLVIASDGIDLKPIVVDSIIINPGERYDFIINASQPVQNYWIRAEMLGKSINTQAILHYTGSPSGDASSSPKACTQTEKCVVLNCPFLYFPEAEHKKCLTYKNIKGNRQDGFQPIANTEKFQEFFLNFGFPGTSFRPPSINGRQFVFPTVAALADPQGVGFNCNNADCGKDRICTCAHSLSLRANNTVQVVLVNMGNGSFGVSHPIHMHGHTFSIVKVGFGNYNTSTGKLLSPNDDIDCEDGLDNFKGFCNNPTWRNPSWLNGNVPGLELNNPVGKDTIILPSGGYVVLRIVANNPGVWFMHCHIDIHAVGGMALMLNESFPNSGAPPQGFPSCKSFTPNNLNKPTFTASQEGSNDNKQSGFIGGIGFLVIIVIIQMIVIGVLVRKIRTSELVSGSENIEL